MKRAGFVIVTAAIAVLATGCSSPRAKPAPPPPPTGVLRLGFTADLADAPALAGLQLGYFAADLGQVTLDPVPFTSTLAEAQALRRGELDAAYLDPMAAVAVWQADQDGGLKIVAGTASGGAELVTRPGITSARQLAHARVAAPAGSAQEVALDWWLRQNSVPDTGPGNATMSAAYLSSALRSGRLDAAWEPAPLDAEITAAGGHVLVNEASLWPSGQFATAVLVVTTSFLTRHAAAVGLLLRGQVRAEEFAATDKTGAAAAANREIAVTAGPALPPAVLAQAFAQLEFTNDPLTTTILAEAQHGAAAGLLNQVTSLDGLFDLQPLNVLLKASGLRQVTG
ncbi:MAG TPA: ABC transporter substrate-binding protein [Streptosporangiaceae bacterium]|nr:ABC transporter substrate-binding protein [Streptosporangiaceae bacterium]